MTLKSWIKSTRLYQKVALMRGIYSWSRRGYSAPSPYFVKHACLLRHGIANATWIETGTFLGQTTEVLSRHGKMIYSIEPEPMLFAAARDKLSRLANVEIINGTSEGVLPELLPRLTGSVNLWLDGHYSAGNTFKGSVDTPIIEEIKCISENLWRFDQICVFIDDVRCFDPQLPEYSSYPELNKLVEWALENQLAWIIEQDIFIAKRIVSTD